MEVSDHLVGSCLALLSSSDGVHDLVHEPFPQYHTTSCAELAGIPRFDVHEMISHKRWAQLDDLLQQWWTICNAINIT